MSFPANQETVKDKVKRVGLGAAKVKSLVSKFEGYIENKNNPCQVSDNEEEWMEELNNENWTKKKRILMPLITSEDELIRKVCLLTTKEEIERLDQLRSESAWRLFILEKEADVFNIETMEQARKLEKEKLREENKEQDIEEDDAKEVEEEDYVKKAADAQNWHLRTQISQILKFYDVPHGEKSTIGNEYFNSNCDNESVVTMFGIDTHSTGPCNSDLTTSQNAKQVHRRRPKRNVKEANSSRDAAVDLGSIRHQSEVSRKQMANVLNHVWDMLNKEKNAREEMQKNIDSLQETVLKEREKRLALEELVAKRSSSIEMCKAGSEIDELKDESKQEGGRDIDQEQQSDAKETKGATVDNPDDEGHVNEDIDTELDEDYYKLVQFQKEQMEMFKKMVENKQEREAAINKSVIKRLEDVETQITCIGFQQQGQKPSARHEDKSLVEELRQEIVELKNKLELANQSQQELQNTIEEKEEMLQICSEEYKKQMQEWMDKSLDVTSVKTELKEASKSREEVQSMIDHQNEEIANCITAGQDLVLLATQNKEEVQMVGCQLQEKLSVKERTSPLLSEQFGQVEKENLKMKEQLNDLVDSLAETVSMNSIVRADGDLTIERLDTMLKAKDNQIKALKSQLQRQMTYGSTNSQGSSKDDAISDQSTNQRTTQGEEYGSACGKVNDINADKILRQELANSRFVNDELRKIIDEREEENRVMSKRIFELRRMNEELSLELHEESQSTANSVKPWLHNALCLPLPEQQVTPTARESSTSVQPDAS
eukprot:gene10146-11180_t